MKNGPFLCRCDYGATVTAESNSSKSFWLTCTQFCSFCREKGNRNQWMFGLFILAQQIKFLWRIPRLLRRPTSNFDQLHFILLPMGAADLRLLLPSSAFLALNMTYETAHTKGCCCCCCNGNRVMNLPHRFCCSCLAPPRRRSPAAFAAASLNISGFFYSSQGSQTGSKTAWKNITFHGQSLSEILTLSLVLSCSSLERRRWG